MAEVRDVIAIDFEALSEGVLISEISKVFKYENDKRTGEILGEKATFLITEGNGKGLQLVVKTDEFDKGNMELMNTYHLVYDKEKSIVYQDNRRQLALSLWATEVSIIK